MSGSEEDTGTGSNGKELGKEKAGGVNLEITKRKRKRATAKRMLTLAIQSLGEAISNNQSNSVVESLFVGVGQCWSSVQAEHAKFLECILDDEEDVPEEQVVWLMECSTKYANCGTMKDKYLLGNTKPTENKSTTIKRRSVKFERSTLKSKISNLNSAASDPTASIPVIQDAQQSMKNQLERYLTSQKELILEMSDEDEAESEMAMCEKMEKLCLDASVAAGKRTKSEESAKKNQEKKHKDAGGIDIKFNRMNLPTFDGDIREYAKFKHQYNKIVKPAMKSRDEQIYILKNECLKKEAEEHVRNVDEDLEEIWKRLEDRFGRPELAARAFLTDLRQIKQVSEGDSTKFIKLADTVERCFRGLERINMDHEISNSTVVGVIEDKLPPSLKTLWSVEVCSNDSKIFNSTGRFQQLLEFLLKHRRAMEYSNADVKPRKPAPIDAPVHHVQESKEDPPKESNPDKSNKERRPGCWYHSTNSHDIFDCNIYKKASVNERWDMVMDYRACWSCLKRGHRQADCYSIKECGTEGCKAKHHPSLHRAPEKKIDLEAADDESVKVSHASANTMKTCLLQLMEVKAGHSGQEKINTFWDGGSKVSLITFTKAKALGLTGEPIRINIIKVGGDRESINSRLYRVPIIDNSGEREYFMAYGMNKISTKIEATDVTQVAKLLKVDKEKVKRPNGEIEMLIGYEYAGFHPQRKRCVDHLLLLENKFGQCLGGSHPMLQEKTQIQVKDVQVSHVNVKLDDFFESETMGVSCVPKCGSCRCGSCPVGGKQYTLQEERELAMIEKGLKLDDERWTATYPWKKDPKMLPNNYNAALGMLRSTEKRLQRNKELAATYSDQISDMVRRGVAKKLTAADKDYDGPVYYISHHEVLKPDSKSTPCRIVFNSSAKFMNETLNDYWVKGPDLINNLLGILIRFRENRIGVAGDVSKMYHTVKLSTLDQHTHRFLWRDMETDRKPDTYVVTSVSFGDKPAGAIASLALKKTAECHLDENPRAARMIIENSYVDDIVDSFDDASLAKETTKEADAILATGSFKIKEWTISKESSHQKKMIGSRQNEEGVSHSKVLGVGWNTESDTLFFETKLNFSPKKRKVRSEPNLTHPECTRTADKTSFST